MSIVDTRQSFSVLMSIYAGNNSEDLDEALLSIKEQTLLPSEVVLVEDGHIDDSLASVVQKYRAKLNIVSVRLRENIGHGFALN